MKTSLLMAAVLAFATSTAAAQQIHLAAFDCGAFGVGNVTNACNSNNGVIVLVGSAVPPTLPSVNSMDAIVDVLQCTPLSAWWRFDAAGCRNGMMAGSFDFTNGPFNCADPWLGQATGTVSVTYPGPNTDVPFGESERLEISCSMSTPTAVDGSTEYYLFKITISKAGTVGGCSGCGVPAGLYLESVTLGQPAGSSGGNPTLTGDGIGQGVSYNGWGYIPGYGAGKSSAAYPGICNVTPTRSPTWGSIKAIYR